MKTSILNTEFNFAKSINLSLIAAPKAYPSYPQGIREFITPYLEELQNKTIIPDYLTLVSIQTIDNQDAGVHILTFTINNPETFDDDDTAEITCLECLRDIFPYDPEACFGQAPLIKRITTVFMVTVPFTC
nr:MAG: hypothetical protein [Bacteriophage sp.]UVX83665.1 MAG: hypothetical protein [Bacteriophage sp.]